MPDKSNDSQDRTETDRKISSEREQSAKDSGTSNGLLIGGMVSLFAGLAAAVYYFSNQPAPAPTTVINTPPNPAAPIAPAPEKQTTIIDRTTEKTAPPQVKVIEKPVIVPGTTKVIQVPNPLAVPAAPSTADKPTTPKASPNPSTSPSPAASKSPAPSTSASPENTNPAAN